MIYNSILSRKTLLNELQIVLKAHLNTVLYLNNDFGLLELSTLPGI